MIQAKSALAETTAKTLPRQAENDAYRSHGQKPSLYKGDFPTV